MSDQNEGKYRQKVREVLADGRLTDLEDTTLGFYQHTLKISDETAMRIFEEVLKEVTAKAGEQPNAVEESGSALKKDEPPKTQQTDKQSIDKESAERITYQSWDEFEKAQYQKGALYKEFMPIAKQFHDMLMSTFQEENKPVEPRYGESTFSFSVPKDLAKSRKRTFASFGMLNLVTQKCYIQNLYKEADDELPEGSRLYKKSDPTVYVYSFGSMSEYESVKPDLKACIIRSYELLSSEKVKGKSEQSSADDESWTLLQDLCYLYYIVAYLPIFLGSKDTKNIKLRIDAATETIFEWLSDDVDGEQLVKEAVGIVTKAWSGDGIKVGYKTKELAAKIKNNMPEENHQLVIKDLQYIVNKWSPNKDYDKKLIERITRVILDDGGSADEETATPFTGDKGTFDSEHIYGMAYVYFDVVMQNDEQSKDEFQAKVHVINEKLSEWAQDSDRITEIMQNCWKTYIHDNDDRETYEGKLEQYIFEMKDNMSEEQLSIVIADLFEIVDISANAHKAEISMIKGLAEIFGFSLEVDQSDTIIKSTKDCLTKDTDPPYPGQFCIPGTLYEDRFRYMPFPKVVGKSTKYKADDLFRRFTSDEVSKIVSKIETENKIPYLVFIKGILDSKMNLPNKAPYWFMPFVIAGRTEGVMLYFDQDGFWYNSENPIVLQHCSPAEMIDSIEIKQGHFNDFVMELFKKDMPSLTVDEGIISTMRISGNDKGRAVEVDIAEMHGEGYGPQLEIMEAIWNIWKDVVEKSRGASSYMFDPAIFKAFNSWQEVIDWAYDSEEKSPGEKKSKEPGKVKAEDDIDARDEDGKTALIRAAEKDDTETVKLFLDRGADIEAKDNEGKTALMMAAGQGHAKTVELLLDKGTDIEADIKSDDEDGGHRALHFAAKEGHTETVELLLSRGADIEAKTNACWTPLMLAAWSGHKEAVGLLLDKGADIEVEDDSGWRALHYAAVTGCTETVELLLDREADIEAKKNDGETALSLAARNGHTETVALLLDKGADIEARDENGYTALIQAANKGQTETVELLLNRGADIEAKTNPGLTALMITVSEGHTETFDILLDRGADIEARTNDDETALMLAAEFYLTKTVEFLLDKGADIEAEGIKGSRALHYAGSNGDAETVELLLDKGADIEAKTHDGRTALMLAANEGHTGTVELLLNRKADIEAKDNEGKTALMLAEENGEAEVVKCFKKIAAGRNKEAVQIEETMQKQETKEQADAETTQEAVSKTEVQMISDEGEKEISQSEKLYRRKVMDVLADGVVSDLERTGLDFTQHKLKLTDEDALRIFDEILAETLKKAAVQAVKTRTDDTERAAVEESMSEETGEEDDMGGNSGKKRITYSSWDEFMKEQSEVDPLKKHFMPIAEKVHDLVIEAFKEQNLPYEVRYGGGSFSFSVPKDLAKSGKRTCVRFGLVDRTKDRTYFDSFYMVEGENLPTGAELMSDRTPRYTYHFASVEDFEKVKQDLKKGVVKSYKILAK